ncbi:MAG: hypothetical protein KDB18_11645 [Salinibacterium sp.]|nr:hypothetical protein [Salinibacterium sp.]
MIAYCTSRPIADHPALRPVYTFWHYEPGLSAAKAVDKAIERAGGLTMGDYAVTDQPPRGGNPEHTYTKEFGPLYSRRGLNLSACYALKGWVSECCDEFRLRLIEAGNDRAPSFCSADHEGYVCGDPDWRDRAEIQRLWDIRGRTVRACVVDPINEAWGCDVEFGNYEDRPYTHDDTDDKGRWLPRAERAVKGVSCPVAYSLARKLDMGKARRKLAKAIGTANAAGVRCVPWINEPELAKVAALYGVDTLIAWGSDKAPSDELQQWVMEQHDRRAA